MALAQHYASQEVPSLVTICTEHFLSNKKSLLYHAEGCLLLYSRLPYMQAESFSGLRHQIMKRLCDYFPILLKKFEKTEELQSIFESQDWEMLQNYKKEQETLKQRLAYLKGTILEREKPHVTLSEFYPLSVLRQGVEWPINVDPANREKFLSDEEFFQVFKMTKEKFRSLASFERIRLKKEKQLF
jgi:hypothetical protein